MFFIPFIFLLLILVFLFYVLYGTNQWRKLFHHIRLNNCFFIKHARRRRNKYTRSEGIYLPLIIPEQGDILRYNNSKKVSLLDSKAPSFLKVISWNIEMGYKLDDVISELKHIAPDVLLLQEADLYNDDGKNYSVHVVHEIANSLDLSSTFAGHHPYKSESGRGIWGNAILSRFNTRKEWKRT
jgi:hypothetical protein